MRRRSLDHLFRDRPHGKRPARVVEALKCPTRALNYGGGAGFADRLDSESSPARDVIVGRFARIRLVVRNL
jgi:hypothetical protein